MISFSQGEAGNCEDNMSDRPTERTWQLTFLYSVQMFGSNRSRRLCCEDYCLVSFDGSGAGNPDSKMKRLLFQKNTQRLHTVPWWVHFVAEGKVLNAKNIWRAGHALKAQRFFTVSKGEHSLHVYHSIFM